jgi:hypothetical protein
MWSATCIVFGALGLVAGIAVLPVGAVCTFLVVGVAAGLTLAIEHESRRQGFEMPGSGRWIRIAAVCFGAWVATIGLGQVLGVGFFLLLVVLAASSPRALRAYAGRWRDSRNELFDCTTTSTARLCSAWVDSYGILQRAETPGVRLRVIAARQEYLDELERRDPEGFNAWLASAASAAGSPERFIVPRTFGG